MFIIVIIIGAAVGLSIRNREAFLLSRIVSVKETNNSERLINNISIEVSLEVTSTVVTTAGKASLNARTSAANLNSIKEYRYYIKKSTNDMYVLDDITPYENHTYINLEPQTSYDVKVEAVCYSGNTMVAEAKGETPGLDY